MNVDDLVKQNMRTHGHLVSIQAYAQGWGTHTLIPENLTGPLVWSYLWDSATNWLWTCCVPVDLFNQVAEEGFACQVQQGEIVGSLGTAMIEWAEDRRSEANDEKTLAIFAALYAGTTQTWQLAEKFSAGGHFVVLAYRQPGSQEISARPFALGGDTRIMLPHAKVVDAIEHVVGIDKLRHPEWFRS